MLYSESKWFIFHWTVDGGWKNDEYLCEHLLSSLSHRISIVGCQRHKTTTQPNHSKTKTVFFVVEKKTHTNTLGSGYLSYGVSVLISRVATYIYLEKYIENPVRCMKSERAGYREFQQSCVINQPFVCVCGWTIDGPRKRRNNGQARKRNAHWTNPKPTTLIYSASVTFIYPNYCALDECESVLLNQKKKNTHSESDFSPIRAIP